MPQSTVVNTYVIAYPGMEPDGSRGADNYITRVSTETTLQIPFGVVVKGDGTGIGCLNLSGQSGNLLGIVPAADVYQVGHEMAVTADTNGNLGLLPGVDISIKRRGRLWVQIDEDVSAGNAVKVRTSNASSAVGPGTFRKSAVTSNTLDLSKFCKWVGVNLAANGYGLLEFDFTMSALATSD